MFKNATGGVKYHCSNAKAGRKQARPPGRHFFVPRRARKNRPGPRSKSTWVATENSSGCAPKIHLGAHKKIDRVRSKKSLGSAPKSAKNDAIGGGRSQLKINTNGLKTGTQKLARVRPQNWLGCAPKTRLGASLKLVPVRPKKWTRWIPKSCLGAVRKWSLVGRQNAPKRAATNCQNDAKKAPKRTQPTQKMIPNGFSLAIENKLKC